MWLGNCKKKLNKNQHKNVFFLTQYTVTHNHLFELLPVINPQLICFLIILHAASDGYCHYGFTWCSSYI